jgi:hypothetical protein
VKSRPIMTTKLTVSRRSLMSILALIACVVFSIVVLWWWREPSITSQPDSLTSNHLTVRSPSSLRRAQQPSASRLSFLSNTNQPYQARLIHLRQISADGISEPELQQLYELLQSPPSKGELPEHWFVIANDIFALLLTHETRPQRLSKQFLEILNHPQQPDVMRDYAVQHLSAWLHPRSRLAAQTKLPPPQAAQSKKILLALAQAATDPSLEHTSIPGTTLMMLADLARVPSGVDCQDAVTALTPWLRQALQDGSTLSHPTRVSAVSAAGILAPDEFRPVIRQIAYQEKADASLRLPAIAALGKIGDEQDRSPLENIAQSSPALHYAARESAAALARRFSESSETSLQE